MQDHILMLLGRLDERSAAIVTRLETIDTRLEHGDERMDTIAERLARLEAPSSRQQPKSHEPSIPNWEIVLKATLPYLLAALALALTGSTDLARHLIIGG